MISVKNLSKYFGDLVVLSDINAEINKGEVISVIGPSGTGKSTLCNALTSLKPQQGETFLLMEMTFWIKVPACQLIRPKIEHVAIQLD